MAEELPALVWDEGKYAFQRKLGNFVQYFQVNLPTNGYGVPMQLVNPYVIAQNMLDCETTDDIPNHIVDEAIMVVDFEDNLPILDGVPVWERFDGEPIEQYKMFKEYREMLYNYGGRAIAKLAATHSIPGKNLNALAKVYHWQLRCKAYDLYRKEMRERQRQMEIEKLESKHAKAADRLLQQSMLYLEEHPEQLNPKTALQMFEVAMKVGRLALGLNPDKPGAGNSSGNTPNINITTHTGTQGGEGTSTVVQVNNETAPDVSYLQSIIHILDKSGALEKADNVIEADFEELSDD